MLQSSTPAKVSSSAKQKKQKLVDQMRTAAPLSSPSPPLSPTISQPKKKSRPRALIEAAKSDQVTKGSLEGTRSTLEDLPPDSALSSSTTAQTEPKTKTDKGLVKVNASLSLPSAETTPKDARKKKVSKTKKAEQFPSKTKHTSDLLDSKVSESSSRRNFLVDNEEEVEDLSVNNLLLKSGSGQQGRITLQGVKATLGRANTPRQSSRPSILSQIETTDNLSGKIRLDPGLSPAENQKLAVSPHSEVQSVKKKASKSKQPALIRLKEDAFPQPTSPVAPLLSAHVSSQMRQATARTVSLNEGLKVGHHVPSLLALSPPLTQFSSPPHFPPAPQTLPMIVERVEKSQLQVWKQNTAENPSEGALTQRSLGQVKLRELPVWLACKTPSHPRDVVDMVQRGWHWYYRKYIDVKKGGVGGLGMLFAGYCVLSYIWSYHHIKLDRWRKYH